MLKDECSQAKILGKTRCENSVIVVFNHAPSPFPNETSGPPTFSLSRSIGFAGLNRIDMLIKRRRSRLTSDTHSPANAIAQP